MTDKLSTSANTIQEDISSIPPTATQRQSKYARSQTSNTATTEPKTVPSKPSIARKIRGNFSL
jgi:hypothetical protein